MMKRIELILAIFLFCLGCKEDLLDTYSGDSAIYFCKNTSRDAWVDTTTFSFAFVTVSDTVLQISVKAMGEAVSYDRKFKVKVEGGNAKAGVNYELLEEACVLQAGEVFSYVPVHLFREGARDTVLYIDLRLEPNEFFQQNMPFKQVNNQEVDITHHVVRFTSSITKPKSWYDSMLGYFSEAKFILLNEELGINAADWFDDSKMPEIGPKAMGGGYYMVNYLNLFVDKDDYVNMPKDPEGPAANRGYMTFASYGGDIVKIPASWPDADDIK